MRIKTSLFVFGMTVAAVLGLALTTQNADAANPPSGAGNQGGSAGKQGGSAGKQGGSAGKQGSSAGKGSTQSFPKTNNSYQPKVSKTNFDKHTTKHYDKNYHHNYGSKFEHGYFYRGFNHSHWSFCCFDRYLGCYTYWCPCTSCYYYYCQPYGCFYPVSYCPAQTYVFVNVTVVPNVPVVPYEGTATNVGVNVGVNGGVSPK